MSVPQELLELVERFNTNREAYRSGQYNETQLRREFIDPFFQLLGWDVNNEKGYAEAYKDVIHEDSIKIGGVTKAPDYCFRIGGVRKFFVETKRPSVNIKDDIDPAFQLRRYAWSAKLPLSILTDFEEFAVYDCRVKPNKTDKASTARIMYVGNWGEFTQHWDEIASIFSREAVLKGSFDRYAESSKAKKGTAEVDTAFLKEIESWRDALARSLALRNPELSQHDLNFAVQRTIDRIIFLRICEDRGIEHYGKLMALQNGDRVYERLCELFYRADERYNSGLFHFQKEKDRSESPDTLTPNLDIDDGALRDIIKNLYYPDSPYEFSVLSADILGQVYEQFLGKVIRLTPGHRAVVEEKPEVRKAGGVYYTPKYIVDYIVKNTVGKLVGAENFQPLRKTTPKEISKIRILDPACGSGSFLLGAYQYLLDWHRDWYVANGPEKWATGRSPALYQIADSNPQSLAGSGLQPEPNISVQSRTTEPAEKSPLGRGLRGGSQNPKLVLDSDLSPTQRGDRGSQIRNWQLTTAERRRILLNNIYGVDIDPQAVEVTKLSLLLKVLEGESEQTIVKQLKMFHERALPDLGNNIKCGNSLIGTDFYHTPQTPLFRGEKMDSPLARGAGGVSDEERNRINPFDWETEFPEIIKPAPAGREQGTGGFDVVIGNPPYGASFSKQEAEYFSQRYKVFSSVRDVYTCFMEKSIALLRTGGRSSFIVPSAWLGGPEYENIREILLSMKIENIVLLPFDVFTDAYVDTTVFVISKQTLVSDHEVKIFIYGKREKIQKIELLEKDYKFLAQNEWINTEGKKFVLDPGTLSLLGHIRKRTTLTFSTVVKIKRGVLFNKELLTEKKTSANSYRYFEGDIYRYQINFTANRWVEFDDRMKERPKEFVWFEGQRILLRRLVNRRQRLMATLVWDTFITNKNLYSILCEDKVSDIRVILGILNSRLISYLYVNQVTQATKDDFPQVTIKDLLTLPFPLIENDKACHDRMVAFVDRMLDLHKLLASAKTDHDKTVIQRQIDATDHQIDRLVYELYGLREEEIKIVEMEDEK